MNEHILIYFPNLARNSYVYRKWQCLHCLHNCILPMRAEVVDMNLEDRNNAHQIFQPQAANKPQNARHNELIWHFTV